MTPAGANQTYNGEAQNLFTAGTSDQGTVYYTLDGGTNWSTTIPTATTVAETANITNAGYVLLGGENIEPVPIEQKLNTSPYISTAVVVGTNEKGEDMRYLSALILPSQDDVEAYAAENGILYDSFEELVTKDEILSLIGNEIAELINAKNGFKSFERINRFELITKPFEIGVELSAKQEMMRYRIRELYHDKIAKMYTAKEDE